MKILLQFILFHFIMILISTHISITIFVVLIIYHDDDVYGTLRKVRDYLDFLKCYFFE
jgi:hypothetical protein